MMMAFLLRLASILPLLMKSGGPLLKNVKSWPRSSHSSRATSYLLMVLSSKSISLRTIRIGLTGGRRCIA